MYCIEGSEKEAVMGLQLRKGKALLGKLFALANFFSTETEGGNTACIGDSAHAANEESQFSFFIYVSI